MRRHVMAARDARSSRRRGSVAMVAVIGLLALSMALALLTLTGNSANVKHTTQAQEDVDLHFLTMAALNQAYVEVTDMTDHDGDGGIGSLATTQMRDSSALDVIGEYSAYVVNTADPDYSDPTQVPNYVIRVMVAVPSLAAPRLTRTAEARITPEVVFALSPKVGAVSVAGPFKPDSGKSSKLANWDSDDFLVDGGSFPAFVFTDEDSRDNFVASNTVGKSWYSNDLDEKITGAPLKTFDRPADANGDEFEAAIALEQDAAFTAEMLNDYRDALREHFQSKITTDSAALDASGDLPNGNIKSGVVALHQDSTYFVKDNKTGKAKALKGGTFNFDNQTVLLDTSKFSASGDKITEAHADGTGGTPTTITGSGTLVILHPVGSFNESNDGQMFNLDWDGDVVVIGYPGDRGKNGGVGSNSPTDNLLYMSRSDWKIDGNLMLLTQGSTEASLEMRGASKDKTAKLEVNGSVMIFGEASSREAEIDIESHAHFKVNGLVAVFGSRVELENQSSSNTVFEVNGTMALGFPDNSSRTDDLFWQVKGAATFRFDQENVEAAIEDLAALQSDLNLSGSNLESLGFTQRATLPRSGTSLAVFQAERQALLDDGHKVGVDKDLILATMKKK